MKLILLLIQIIIIKQTIIIYYNIIKVVLVNIVQHLFKLQMALQNSYLKWIINFKNQVQNTANKNNKIMQIT